VADWSNRNPLFHSFSDYHLRELAKSKGKDARAAKAELSFRENERPSEREAK
jgi:hypothetical protein